MHKTQPNQIRINQHQAKATRKLIDSFIECAKWEDNQSVEKVNGFTQFNATDQIEAVEGIRAEDRDTQDQRGCSQRTSDRKQHVLWD